LGRYDRYILSQLIVLFGFFCLVLISVYWVNEAVDLFDSLIADGQTLGVFFEFTILTLPQIMLLVLPVAAFVATLYSFNRLISESELVVLQTSGVSALRLLRPVLIFGTILGLIVFVLSNFLAPAARGQFLERGQEVQDDLVGKFLREGQFIHPTDGLTVYIRDITDLGEFHDLFLQDRSSDAIETTYTARRALLVRGEAGARLVMFEGMAQTFDRQGNRLSTVRFDDFSFDLARLGEDDAVRRYDLRELPTRVLLTAPPEAAERMGLDLAQMRFEGHSRIARALFVIFPPLIAAATLMLGGFSRFGVWPQILAAVAMIIPLQMVWNAAETAAIRDVSLQYIAYVQPGLTALLTAILVWLAMRTRQQPRRRGMAT